ncbi:aldehyde dehydrogenase family protein [Chitinimonas sp.]|uniref:aldehyde dehydrogenase family protein n=1 Tax=Chitinimonas sp. TaxID=1934313 RepID=UPI002F95EE73
MHEIAQIYVDGQFVTPHGEEWFDLYNPAKAKVIGRVRLADAEDAAHAIAAAKRAFASYSQTSKAARLALLQRMHAAIAAREDALMAAIIEEYGAPISRARWMAKHAANVIQEVMTVLAGYDFAQRAGTADVVMQPLGVAGLITPWNSNAGFICGKLAAALAAGCTAVVKPSEMSALQTRIVAEALHEADLPAGVVNIVTGRGEVVGAAISLHPDVAKVSFTGSTTVGKAILRAGAETLKRVTLELGGKSPVLVLDDADLAQAASLAAQAGFMNSGQACIAGTRILVPRPLLADFEALLAAEVMARYPAGDPQDPATAVGPMVSRKQWERVQHYIRVGLEEGARLLVGGTGRPAGLAGAVADGWFVQPTVFSDVHNQMTIARDEIFGPVLSLIPYGDEEEAIAIANDTRYGLQAYVLSADPLRARAVADRIDVGRVLINTVTHEPAAPFGGFKQSGIGREYGRAGLEAYMEPRAILGVHRA